MKKVTKKFKPAYTLDLTNCETVEDVFYELVWTKVEAGLDIPAYQVQMIVDMEVEDSFSDLIDGLFDGNDLIITEHVCINCPKKAPWYKRFWNWIIRKK